MANNQRIVYDEVNQKIILNGKAYTKDAIQNFSITFLILGILLLLISFFIMPLGLFFLVFGLYILLQSVAYGSYAKTLEMKIASLAEKEPAKPKTHTNISTPHDTEIYNNAEIRHDTEIYNVAGISYHQKEIASLAVENVDFSLSKSDLIDLFMTDEKIYQYSFRPIDIQLVEEPDNEYDPNAIKVVIDGVHVGYIKKESCLHVKELISTDKINRITADIHGGKYKILVSDYDMEKDKEVYNFERDETDYFVVLKIELK